MDKKKPIADELEGEASVADEREPIASEPENDAPAPEKKKTVIDRCEGNILATALFLSQTAGSISKVTEDEKILRPAEYRLRQEGQQIERLPADDGRRTWGNKVAVEFVPLRRR